MSEVFIPAPASAPIIQLHVWIGHYANRGVWLVTWVNLPGLMLNAGSRTYTHTLLPGWKYTPAELRTEIIEDLERFANTGEQPKVATR